jgi:hypothetical protein
MTIDSLRKIYRHFGLSIVLLLFFIATVVVQCLVGRHVWNQQLYQHRQAGLSIGEYVKSPHFWQALSENWESEFLQMGMFVVLTACLYQKGSPESKDPDAPVSLSEPSSKKSGSIKAWLYNYSLSLTLLMLFAVSWVMHAVSGAMLLNQQSVMQHRPPQSVWEYITGSRFWFESMQNWQSEFLSIAAMVILGIFLRHKGSPESKTVSSKTWDNK